MGTRRRLIQLARELFHTTFGRRALMTVRGDSMWPLLDKGDVVWVDTTRGALPAPDTIVVVRHPSEPRQLLIKRVRSRGDASFSVGSDNPVGATDSRHFGSLGPDALVGRAILAASRARGIRRLG